MKRTSWLLSALVCCVFAQDLSAASVASATSKRSLESILDKNELAIVLFYEQDRETRTDTARNESLEELEKSFDSASKSEIYVKFIRVNLAKDKSGTIREEYGIGSTPIMMLFRNGLPYEERGQVDTKTFWGTKRGDVKSPIVLPGFKNRSEIVNFVRDYFNEYIDEIKQQKREEAAERRARSYYYGPYWGFGFGAPYYWYPYGYYRPGFGVYWGW